MPDRGLSARRVVHEGTHEQSESPDQRHETKSRRHSSRLSRLFSPQGIARDARDAILQKRHRVLTLARVLLAVPAPAYLVFSAIQYNQVDTVTAGWGLSVSYTQIKTGRTFAVVVVLITIPLWMFSLLVAQMQKEPNNSAETPAPTPIAPNIDSTEAAQVAAAAPSPAPAAAVAAAPAAQGAAERKQTPIERLVGHLKHFQWDDRIWTWPKAFEAALFFGSSYAYSALYNTYNWPPYVTLLLASLPVLALILFTVTRILRSIIDYQYDQKVNLLSFVNLQASRLSILTLFGASLSIYALSAMSRVVIRYELLDPFAELSLNGITCTDRDAFWTAFEASAANASCAALPNCGYSSFEKLCRAVQYAPMVGSVDVDLTKVLVFGIVAWLLISLLVFGTGRANPNNDYAHLLSPHMLVAMVLGLGQTMNTVYAFVRLLLIVPLLRLPRPAAYFDEKGVMDLELPLYCHGSACNLADFYATMLGHVLIFIVVNFDFLKRYASLIRAGGQEAIDEHIKKMKEKKEWRDEEPYFYFVSRKFVLECRTRSLPPMQTLRDVGHLEKLRIPLRDAFNQAKADADEAARAGKAARVVRERTAVMKAAVRREMDKEVAVPAAAAAAVGASGIEAQGINVFQIKDILFVSHRWEEPGRPDVNGVQLQAIQEYLKTHPEIMWVWFDYSSMPQKLDGIDTRTPKEKAEFQLMLKCMTDLYLTVKVLILLDGSYASRFWTLTEAWCSMQTATNTGLCNSISSTEDADFTGSDVQVGSRCTIKCIHNAAKGTTSKGLVDLVATKTPKAIYGILASPDVNVTNTKDKEAMLPIIQKTNERVIESFKNDFQTSESPIHVQKSESPIQRKCATRMKSETLRLEADKRGDSRALAQVLSKPSSAEACSLERGFGSMSDSASGTGGGRIADGRVSASPLATTPTRLPTQSGPWARFWERV